MCASRARRSTSSSPTRSGSAGAPSGSRRWGSDFNYDFHVSFTKDQLAGNVYYNYAEIPGTDAFDELPGLSVFAKDDAGNVFHTYSSYARGNEEVIGVFMYLDITPKGRNEKEIMDWVRRNDEYDQPAQSSCHVARSA